MQLSENSLKNKNSKVNGDTVAKWSQVLQLREKINENQKIPGSPPGLGNLLIKNSKVSLPKSIECGLSFTLRVSLLALLTIFDQDSNKLGVFEGKSQVGHCAT